MARYRKKPVEIEARQFPQGAVGDEHYRLATWCGGELSDHFTEGPRIEITTIHGEKAIARPGDWIVPEPQAGRFYPIKDDIFQATYEAVGDSDDAETRED